VTNRSGAPNQIRIKALVKFLLLNALLVMIGGALFLPRAVREMQFNDSANLQQLSMALTTYHQLHGRLPSAVIYNDQGEPLYSWRVALLPFLEEQPLYNAFHRDEPWDSPSNLRLLSQMPAVYGLRPRISGDFRAGYTLCKVFTGKDTPFEGKQGLSFKNDFVSCSQTFLVVKAGAPVPWTKPEDIEYDPLGPLPDLNTPEDNFFRVSMGGGSTRVFLKGTSERTLRALISRTDKHDLGKGW